MGRSYLPCRGQEASQNALAVFCSKRFDLSICAWNGPPIFLLLDPVVREAIAYAIDKQAIADTVYAGFARPWGSIVAPPSGDWVNPDLEPEPFLRAFIERIGAGPYSAPSPLTPEIELSVRALMAERGPWEAEIPFAELAAAPFPKLVFSGAHSEAFDTVCDVLDQRLRAERAVLPGARHSIPRAPGFNERLEDFLRRAEPL